MDVMYKQARQEQRSIKEHRHEYAQGANNVENVKKSRIYLKSAISYVPDALQLVSVFKDESC